jgi:hypothetical protein
MGRPPLGEDEIRDKVLAYCGRYRVSPGPGGVPPFPSGKRETRQHREWLTVYRAVRRLEARSSTAASAVAGPDSICPVCALALKLEEAVSVRAAGRRAASWNTHRACADLLRLGQKAGPEAIGRLNDLLWPRRGSYSAKA